jgi:hypothetical protein
MGKSAALPCSAASEILYGELSPPKILMGELRPNIV